MKRKEKKKKGKEKEKKWKERKKENKNNSEGLQEKWKRGVLQEKKCYRCSSSAPNSQMIGTGGFQRKKKLMVVLAKYKIMSVANDKCHIIRPFKCQNCMVYVWVNIVDGVCVFMGMLPAQGIGLSSVMTIPVETSIPWSGNLETCAFWHATTMYKYHYWVCLSPLKNVNVVQNIQKMESS